MLSNPEEAAVSSGEFFQGESSFAKGTNLRDYFKEQTMAWFFADNRIEGDSFTVTGEDAKHIEKSLRMRVGEELTLVSSEGEECLCEISAFTPSGVEVEVKDRKATQQEASVEITLYQSLTKGDKMDFVVQKSVELGVSKIVPVITSRCVSRPDEKQLFKKTDRWQKIALGAAQQSCRGKIPQVSKALSFEDALKEAREADLGIIFYEGGGEALHTLPLKKAKTAAVFIGCEGGFDRSEVEKAESEGLRRATLGKRILRAETAPLAALSSIMCLTGNFD
ncbi:MAG: 16S rRNA (uracil(1498)-N(3))-methyltransferase [Ruminococcus sp.]